MSPYLITCAGLWCALVLLLTGCNRTDPTAPGRVQEDIFVQKSATLTANLIPTVSNDLGGNITIIAANQNPVDGDFIDTGTGNNLESARIEAQDHITPANDAGSARIQRRDARQEDHAWLHLRVPPGTNLPNVHALAGNIDIHGAVGDVTAVISTSGNIDVMGGNGDVNLSTPRGSIRVDLMSGKNITASATEGNIEIIAEHAVVSATNKGGSVRFIGSLRSGASHTLATTAGGIIAVAIPVYVEEQPDNLVLRVHASTSSQPIVTDYPPDQRKDGQKPLAICGVINSSGPYDYHVENTSFRFGRIEISSSPTMTHLFTGTLTDKYYRFDTNQSRLSLFTPRALAIHIYTAAEFAQIAAGKIPVDADCEEALKANLDQRPAIELNLRSGTGRIFVHFIDRQ